MEEGHSIATLANRQRMAIQPSNDEMGDGGSRSFVNRGECRRKDQLGCEPRHNGQRTWCCAFTPSLVWPE